MSHDALSALRMAMTLKAARRRQITDSSESLRLQQGIYDAVDHFYKLLDDHGFFCDEDKRRLLGIGLTITCDTNGDMEIIIHDSSQPLKDGLPDQIYGTG
jgi:hypothetical protein